MSSNELKQLEEKMASIDRVVNTTDITLLPIKIKFSIKTLNAVIAFLLKSSALRTRKNLMNLNALFNKLDDSMYENNKESLARIWLIRQILICRLDQAFDDTDFITDFCMDKAKEENDEMKMELIHTAETYSINYDESVKLIRKMEDALRYGYIVSIKNVWQDFLDTTNSDPYSVSYKKMYNSIKKMSASVLNIDRSTSSISKDHRFSLVEEEMDQMIDEAIDELTDRNRIFTTGIQRLNTLLSPGFMNKRLYIFLAFPGKGKSTILLKSAMDIKKYNGNVEAKDPTKRPAVVFLTLENSIAETVERMYNMMVSPDDIRNYRKGQIKKQMRDAGFKITDKNKIDIIILEYKNREIDTNDIYTIIQDLSDEGIETIALIVDYIKRIRPYEKANSEKEELKNISNELKEIAKEYDIPVITAQQLNRSASSVVDGALQNNKQDVTRLVGRDGIAGAWEIIENGDFVCIVNPEKQVETGIIYLTFKMLKRRYRSSEDDPELRACDYFNHPFEQGNEIKLIDDVDMDESISLVSLTNKFTTVDAPIKPSKPLGDGKTTPKANNYSVMDNFEEFNTDQAENL